MAVDFRVNFLTLNRGLRVNFLTLKRVLRVNFLTLNRCSPFLAWPTEVLKTRDIKNKILKKAIACE